MSDESMNDVVSDVSGVDPDLTWDNVEEAAPSLADQSADSAEGMDDEWNSLDSEDNDAEAKVEASDEDKQEDSDASSEDESTEEVAESDGEESEEVSEDDNKSDEVEEEGKAEDKPLNVEELPDDTKLMVKVDGELQEITLKEYKNGISGEKAIAKRFNEFNVKEKEFQSQMDEVNAYINELGATMRDQSILGGVQKIGELVNMPPHLLKEELIKELMPEIEKRYGMSDEEIQLEYKSAENEYLKQQTESNNERLKLEQAQRELDAKVLNLRETHNISSEEWKQAEQTLDQAGYAKEEITPELIVKYNNFTRAESRADSIINDFDASYKDNSEVMDALVDQIFENPDLSDEDFHDILKDALGESKKEKAEASVEKTVKAKGKAKKEEPKKNEPSPITDDMGEEILDWDDLI